MCAVTARGGFALRDADGDSPWDAGGIPVENVEGACRGWRTAYTHPRSLQASATRATATR